MSFLARAARAVDGDVLDASPGSHPYMRDEARSRQWLSATERRPWALPRFVAYLDCSAMLRADCGLEHP